MDEIIIIDAFINEESNEKKLKKFIDKIKLTNLPILLISNTIIDKDIINKVEYYIYDSNNRLFEDDKFNEYDKFILWEKIDDIKFNNIHLHKQKHALSVMVNMFNALNYIKNLGYEYFHRIEYDTILGEKTIENIKTTKETTKKKGKKGKFNLNHQRKSHGFQYFFCEIDYFIEIIPNIKNQQNYIDSVREHFNTNKFIIVEEFMYKFLKDKEEELNLVDKHNNSEIDDSTWNTTTSQVHLDDFEKRCKTRIYKGNEGFIVLSKNFTEDLTHRDIKFYKNNQEIKSITHSLNGKNTYRYDIINEYFDYANIIENGKLIICFNYNDINDFYEK